MWQKVAKFKGAEYFRKALYSTALPHTTTSLLGYPLLQYCGLTDTLSHTSTPISCPRFLLYLSLVYYMGTHSDPVQDPGPLVYRILRPSHRPPRSGL